MSTFIRRGVQLAVVTAVLLSGCTALTKQVLVDEAGRPAPADTRTVAHCSGSAWEDNSVMAVVPIPIIGLGMPTQEINAIKVDDVLSRCGPPNQLIHRRVVVDRTACVPTVLTRVISFGVWQWCPANVSWNADLIAPNAPPASVSLAPPPEREVLGYRPSGYAVSTRPAQ